MASMAPGKGTVQKSLRVQRANHLQVNNAGMGRDNAALFDGKTSSWVEMISTNVLGPCMCTREALQVRSAAATKP